MLVGFPVVRPATYGGSHVLVILLDNLMFQLSCRGLCNSFCFNESAVGEALRGHALIQLSCSYEHECSVKLGKYQLFHDRLRREETSIYGSDDLTVVDTLNPSPIQSLGILLSNVLSGGLKALQRDLLYFLQVP